jgi:hypothetical protein
VAAVVLAARTWTTIPIPTTAGTVTITNASLAGPVYFRVFVAGVLVDEFKDQPGGVTVARFPANATAQAACAFAQTLAVT